MSSTAKPQHDTTPQGAASWSPELAQAVARACARIAPTWPLDRFIAVNPFWGMIDQPLPEVAAALRARSGAQLLMPRDWYRQAYTAGRLRDEHLAAALQEQGSSASLADLRALLVQAEPPPSVCARLVDVVDAGRDLVHGMSWRNFVAHSVSQFCAAQFDEDQAALAPIRAGGLYASWRSQALHDRSPGLLMGLKGFRTWAQELPDTAHALIAQALDALDIAESEREPYLWSLLLDQNGWASWCAYRSWNARLAGGDDDALVNLLAIRLAWEWLLLRTGGISLARRWKLARATWAKLEATAAAARPNDWLLQTAVELAWRQPVVRALAAGFDVARPAAPAVQAVFCIDVRSEVFRRALEDAAPAVQTLGFAGFFGLPIDYRPIGAAQTRPQLPGLLAPSLRAGDSGIDADAAAQRQRHLADATSWKSFKTDALSTFTFVEALGPTYLGHLLVDSLGLRRAPDADAVGLPRHARAQRRPQLAGTVADTPLSNDARSDLAAGMLRAMSLTHGFADIVLLAGHGSATRNNPHAAGLDCGACCGQTGEVNARAAAALLNAPEVRAGLAQRGIAVPAKTVFVAGLHNTTTDDLALFDHDLIPAAPPQALAQLRAWLADAGTRARAQRAESLGLGCLAPARLHRALHGRTQDWAQVRAEWGLANNAALIVAPRERCRHLDLHGRSFLHEYRQEEDPQHSILELIMTAPMVVTHWINFQYYASTVDTLRYGSGNKVLHNVVGGHIGVFEGNGGDLRIGLPLQSVHDGAHFVHTPLRLSVFIEAPRAAIDGVMAKHAHVAALVAHGWLTLLQIDTAERAIYVHRDGQWHRQEAGRA